MKAVIVELNGKHAVALCSNGQFEKIRNNSYSIGQEIQLPAQMVRFPKQTAVAACAALAITACGGFGSYTWSNPISYVSLDINPSIAYSLNEFNRVISIDGMNEEGIAIADEIGDSVKNADITTALTITVEQLSTDAYIDNENTNYMIIGVYSDKDKKADALMTTVDAFTASTTETCSITTVNVSKETKETADSYGITAGKMELINEIANVAADPAEADPAALADLTVAELEQTKAAVTTGASVSEAVAAATPDHDTDDAAPAADPNAVASDAKPSETADATSSDKKDNEPATADAAATATSDSISVPSDDPQTPVPADSSSPASGTTTVSDPPAPSTDKNGNASSGKKDDATTGSPTKGETVSSDKKDESSSSSDKKGESSSSEKKDTVTEDDSQQTNTAPSDEYLNEAQPDVWDADMQDMIIAGNMLS